MSYKANHYAIHNCIEARDFIKDFLVACGWQLVGPTDTEPHRIAQDDKHARILGWFLQSNGEDGNRDLHLHLSTGYDYADKGHTWWYDWLESGITDVQTDGIPLLDATTIVAGAVVEINGEQILVGSVDTSGGGGPGNPHYLNGCTRGHGGTTATAHDAGDVVSLLFNNGANFLRLYIDNYVYCDLVNPIAQSDDSGGIGWTLGQTGNADPIVGIDAFPSGRTFEYTSLIKAVGGSEDGKMRWVTGDDGAGRLVWTKFKSAPGAVNCGILSTGWGLASHSRNQIIGTISDYKSSSPYGFQTYEASPGTRDMWLYGNKDGFVMVYKTGTTYRIYYYGAYIPFANPLYTTANKVGGGNISAGAITFEVANTDLFAVGGKYRIVMQDYRDWIDNWDRSADTNMGASPGDWPDLEADEMVQENVVVQSIGVGTITVELPLIYSYRSGAVIGEDPRPIVSQCNRNGTSNYNVQFADVASQMGASVPFHSSGKDKYRISHPSHRRRDRCFDYDGTNTPWGMDGGRDYYSGMEQCRTFLEAWDSAVMDNNENYLDKLLLVPISLGWYETTTREPYGGPPRAHGVLPLIRKMMNSLGAADEDTVKVPWDGKMETFRIFYDDGAAAWFCVGPELWP